MSEKTNAPKKPVEAAPAPGGRRRGAASMSQVIGSMDNLKRAMKYYIKCSPALRCPRLSDPWITSREQ